MGFLRKKKTPIFSMLHLSHICISFRKICVYWSNNGLLMNFLESYICKQNHLYEMCFL